MPVERSPPMIDQSLNLTPSYFPIGFLGHITRIKNEITGMLNRQDENIVSIVQEKCVILDDKILAFTQACDQQLGQLEENSEAWKSLYDWANEKRASAQQFQAQVNAWIKTRTE